MKKEQMYLNLKEADTSDIEFTYILRNQENVYRYFRNSSGVKTKDHIIWIDKIINHKRDDITLYIILYYGERVGQLRFDKLDDKSVEISISILSKFRKMNIATNALKKGINLMEQKGITNFIAEVHIHNFASVFLFKKLNFTIQKTVVPYSKMLYTIVKPSDLAKDCYPFFSWDR